MFNYCLRLSSCVPTFLPKFPYTREQRVLLGQVDTKVGGYSPIYVTGSLTSNIVACSGIWFLRVWALWAWPCECYPDVVCPQLNDVLASRYISFKPSLRRQVVGTKYSLMYWHLRLYTHIIFRRDSTLALKQHSHFSCPDLVNMIIMTGAQY
jgi:hypothetical protein